MGGGWEPGRCEGTLPVSCTPHPGPLPSEGRGGAPDLLGNLASRCATLLRRLVAFVDGPSRLDGRRNRDAATRVVGPRISPATPSPRGGVRGKSRDNAAPRILCSLSLALIFALVSEGRSAENPNAPTPPPPSLDKSKLDPPKLRQKTSH